jgi:hypothetical protein
MFKKLITFALVILLVQVTCASTAVVASTRAEKEAQLADKIKTGIARLGTGKQALVKVKLRDGTRLAGYISEANENSFVIVDAKTGNSTTVAYPNVTQVKGNNLSSGVWLAIGNRRFDRHRPLNGCRVARALSGAFEIDSVRLTHD